jgi:regulator-associated protein of mTOR
MTPTHWRDQRIMVQSMSRAVPLSNYNVPNGISSFPHSARGGGGGPSLFIPRSTSLVFHPLEMLYGVGSADGTSEFFFIVFLDLVIGLFADYYYVAVSPNYGL